MAEQEAHALQAGNLALDKVCNFVQVFVILIVQKGNPCYRRHTKEGLMLATLRFLDDFGHWPKKLVFLQWNN